ncbi:MAG: hypothetical protein J5716_01205 [Alphaproteobacteria bacterium]|nr:hypothetical protein [Alphaproteobacteria bacterium]
MLKIKSSILWRLKAAIVCLGLLQVTACGFRPLFVGQETDDAVSGQQLIQEMASVFIDEIPDRIGQILRRSLVDRLTPKGEPENPHYRLFVNISGISTSEQAVRKDNLATRYLMTISVSYKLYSYPENELLLSDSFTGRSGYDVQRSPYATDVAEKAVKERLVKIIGDDIALRLAAFLKSYRPAENTVSDTEQPAGEKVSDKEKPQ